MQSATFRSCAKQQQPGEQDSIARDLGSLSAEEALNAMTCDSVFNSAGVPRFEPFGGLKKIQNTDGHPKRLKAKGQFTPVNKFNEIVPYSIHELPEYVKAKYGFTHGDVALLLMSDNAAAGCFNSIALHRDFHPRAIFSGTPEQKEFLADLKSGSGGAHGLLIARDQCLASVTEKEKASPSGLGVRCDYVIVTKRINPTYAKKYDLNFVYVKEGPPASQYTVTVQAGICAGETTNGAYHGVGTLPSGGFFDVVDHMFLSCADDIYVGENPSAESPLGYAYWLVSVQKVLSCAALLKYASVCDSGMRPQLQLLVDQGRSDETRQRHRDLARTAVLKLEEVLREGHPNGPARAREILSAAISVIVGELSHTEESDVLTARADEFQRQAEKIKCWYEKVKKAEETDLRDWGSKSGDAEFDRDKLKRVFFWMRICAKLEALMDEWHIEGVRLAKAMIAMEWGHGHPARKECSMLAKEIGRRGRYIKEVAYGIEFTIPLVQFFQREFVLIQASIIKIGSLSAKEVDEARDEGQAEAEARWDDAAFSAVWGVGDNALSPPAPFGFSGRPALAFDEHGLPELAEADAVGFNWATFEARIDEKAKEAQMRLLEEGLVPAPPPASSAPAPLAPAPSPPALCPTYGERCAHGADCALNGSHLLPAKKARLGLFSPHPLSPALSAPPVANRTVFVQQAGAIPASPPVTVDVEGGIFEMELEPAPSQALATQGSAPGSPPPSQPSLPLARPLSEQTVHNAIVDAMWDNRGRLPHPFRYVSMALRGLALPPPCTEQLNQILRGLIHYRLAYPAWA
eukprot:tig00020564_g11457.t1